MLLIYTGEGKGKTSASVGQALRAMGQGLRVAFGQFMKRKDQAGEQKMLNQLLGTRFLAQGAGFYRQPQDFAKHRHQALLLLDWAKQQVHQGLDMLILDEALYALGHGLLRAEEVQELMDQCQGQDCHIVLSGRGAPDWLVAQADIVSEIRALKHSYTPGQKPCPGIEF